MDQACKGPKLIIFSAVDRAARQPQEECLEVRRLASRSSALLQLLPLLSLEVCLEQQLLNQLVDCLDQPLRLPNLRSVDCLDLRPLNLRLVACLDLLQALNLRLVDYLDRLQALSLKPVDCLVLRPLNLRLVDCLDQQLRPRNHRPAEDCLEIPILLNQLHLVYCLDPQQQQINLSKLVDCSEGLDQTRIRIQGEDFSVQAQHSRTKVVDFLVVA